jgi:hypothetical protein
MCVKQFAVSRETKNGSFNRFWCKHSTFVNALAKSRDCDLALERPSVTASDEQVGRISSDVNRRDCVMS